jgi:peptidyl-dipeptidase Dcp
MHRRQLLVAGGSLFALSACAANGMSMGGGTPAATLASAGAAPGRVVALKRATWPSATVPAGVDLDGRGRHPNPL